MLGASKACPRLSAAISAKVVGVPWVAAVWHPDREAAESLEVDPLFKLRDRYKTCKKQLSELFKKRGYFSNRMRNCAS